MSIHETLKRREDATKRLWRTRSSLGDKRAFFDLASFLSIEDVNNIAKLWEGSTDESLILSRTIEEDE